MKQKYHQKVFNRGTLRFCEGSLGLCGRAWHSTNWQNLNWFIVFHVSLWGGLELWLWGISTQKPPVATGLLWSLPFDKSWSSPKTFL